MLSYYHYVSWKGLFLFSLVLYFFPPCKILFNAVLLFDDFMQRTTVNVSYRKSMQVCHTEGNLQLYMLAEALHN